MLTNVVPRFEPYSRCFPRTYALPRFPDRLTDPALPPATEGVWASWAVTFANQHPADRAGYPSKRKDKWVGPWNGPLAKVLHASCDGTHVATMLRLHEADVLGVLDPDDAYYAFHVVRLRNPGNLADALRAAKDDLHQVPCPGCGALLDVASHLPAIARLPEPQGYRPRRYLIP